MNRDLDGVYFRVKRGKHWESICFSDLPSEKSIIEAQTDWKFIKDKQLGYKAYCPKCQEKMKKESKP